MPNMNMEPEIVLNFRLPNGQSVGVARVIDNPALVRRVAREAVQEAKLRARALRRMDPVLGRLGASEARRLSRAMQTILDGAS